MALTPQQKRFVEEYMLDLNATAAYKRAGYKGRGRSAENAASQLLGNIGVKAAIAAAKAERSKRTEVAQDAVIEELRRVAFLDARRVFEWGPDGVTVKASADLSPEDASCVTEASQTVTKDGGTIRVKLADKLKALELLGKHLGMFADRVEHSGPGGGPIPHDHINTLLPADIAAARGLVGVACGGVRTDGGPESVDPALS